MMIVQPLNVAMTRSRIDSPLGHKKPAAAAAGFVLNGGTTALAAQLTAFFRNCRNPVASSSPSNSVNATSTASNDR
jgi:hypothetical protein